MQHPINKLIDKISDDSLSIADLKDICDRENNKSELDLLFRISLFCISKSKNNYAIAILKSLSKKNLSDLRVPYNLGLLYANANQHAKALVAFDNALSIEQTNPESLANKGFSLFFLGQYHKALDIFNSAIRFDPLIPESYFGLGNSLFELRRFEEAIEQYEKALSINPNYAEAYSNKGNSLFELRRFEEAIEQYEKALSINPNYAEAYSNKGASFKELRNFPLAIEQYEKALSINSKLSNALEYLIHLRMKICQWNNFEATLNQLKRLAIQDNKVLHPFIPLSLIDDPAIHQRIAQNYCSINYPENLELGEFPTPPSAKKIRIGYFSADFRVHPVAQLSADLFELHDRELFEVIAFSLKEVSESDVMSSRLSKTFDRFINVEHLSDLEVAKMARDLNINIAVDLGGHTQNARTSIFAYRAAPIQINYLGYPGTIGSSYIDYIMADQTLIPLDSTKYYSEKIIYLPNSYQINSRKIDTKSLPPKKADFGLPNKGFIFCCFNSSYKILPETFSRWMQILHHTNDSVLWLLEDNPWAISNLKKEAQLCGISNERLIFTKPLPPDEHIKRISLGNLFLDTFPYSGHTTTSDALWAGLPVLTLIGNSFASRVSASLLNTIGLPELVAKSTKKYIDLAIDIANNPQLYLKIRSRLALNTLSSPLFNSHLTTIEIEKAYKAIFDEHIKKTRA